MSVIWEAASDAGLTRPRSVPRPRAARQQQASSPGAPILSDQDGLRRTFTLLPEDLALVRTARTARNQLGLALLLAWMRAERRAVADPATLPAELVAFIAGEIDVSPESLEGYGDRSRRGTRIAHIRSICRYLGLRPLEPTDQGRLEGFLRTKVAQTGSTAALVDAAEAWLLSEGLLRPAATTLDRLVGHVRATAEEELFSHICRQLSGAQRARLDALSQTSEGQSPLAAMRVPPRAPSASSIRLQCQRLEAVPEASAGGSSGVHPESLDEVCVELRRSGPPGLGAPGGRALRMLGKTAFFLRAMGDSESADWARLIVSTGMILRAIGDIRLAQIGGGGPG